MNKIKINVAIEQTEAILIFTISLYNFSEKTITSNISDDSGGFTRRTANLYDEDQNKVARGVNYLSPVKYTENLITLEVGGSAQFIIKARLEEIGNSLFLDFRGVNFNVVKNKTYYFQIEYLDSASEMIPFHIS